jgi:hypothetical protein
MNFLHLILLLLLLLQLAENVLRLKVTPMEELVASRKPFALEGELVEVIMEAIVKVYNDLVKGRTEQAVSDECMLSCDKIMQDTTGMLSSSYFSISISKGSCSSNKYI